MKIIVNPKIGIWDVKITLTEISLFCIVSCKYSFQENKWDN